MAAVAAAVSVVVPCYRCAGTVERAVRSAFEQTLAPLEVILVDDGSPDGTAQALSVLQTKYPDFLRIISFRENRGPSAARNAGWDAARGEYVAFLDADDSWHPRKLEIQCEVMHRRPDAALCGHRHVLGALPETLGASEVKTLRASQILWRNRFVTPSAMLRRELSERFRESQRHMEDHLLWMQIAFAGRGVLLIEAPLAAIHKPIFGVSGQSAQLFAMERAELGNYALLWHAGHIGLARLVALWAWSFLKFLRRLAVVGLRRASVSR